MAPAKSVPVIDRGDWGKASLPFAEKDGASPFPIALSIEKDRVAQQTLHLRSFFRKADGGNAPADHSGREARKRRWTHREHSLVGGHLATHRRSRYVLCGLSAGAVPARQHKS